MALPSGGGRDRAGPWLAVKGEKAREQGAPQTLVALLSGCETTATLCAHAVLPIWNGWAASEVRAAGVEGGEPHPPGSPTHPSHLRLPHLAVPQLIHCKPRATPQAA